MINKVGIVLLNYNGSDYFKITLESIINSKTNVSFCVGVLDNGSTPDDCLKVQSICNQCFYLNKKIDGFFIQSEKNLGFSGGNNVIIRKFLSDSSVSHICLLNSDVIVTDYWLDRLLALKVDAVGPVTNATGNEQTIGIDYSVSLENPDFQCINRFAQKRYKIFENYSVITDILYFFCVLFSRDVFMKIGLLDEQFYPGSYEDNDFCVRMSNAKVKMYINRGCYMHHFGSSSFATLDINKRVLISNENRDKFEKKWNIKCKGTTWKLLLSCRQDMEFLVKQEYHSENFALIKSEIMKIESILLHWEDVISYFQSDEYAKKILEANGRYGSNKGSLPSAYPFIMPPLEYLSGKMLLRLAGIKALHKIKRALFNQKSNHESIASVNDKVMWHNLIHTIRSNGSICVFAPIFTKDNEKDGYIQRIKAIDETILCGYIKIYLMGDNRNLDHICIEKISDDRYFVQFDSFIVEQRKQIFDLIKISKKTYIHSIMRFMTDSVAREMCDIFALPGVYHVWDVHGSVPEEYALMNANLGRDIANEVEKYLYNHVNLIVCVNNAMKDHLINKYGNPSANFIILPIFNNNISQIIDCEKDKFLLGASKPVIVYSGGLQKWQNIEQMQDAIERTMMLYFYKIFVPEPIKFQKQWGKRKTMTNVLVASRAPDEMGQEYRECRYGLVLRDDIVVNRVACPTKIIEYIQYGIIPVFKSPKIGDFVSLGIRFITIDELIQGKLPDDLKRKQMMQENYTVLKKLMVQHDEGSKELIDALSK
jgi:GT2 family glycosyltransferase